MLLAAATVKSRLAYSHPPKFAMRLALRKKARMRERQQGSKKYNAAVRGDADAGSPPEESVAR